MLGPASFSISAPMRGPTPPSEVTGLNRGNRISGRMAAIEPEAEDLERPL